MQERWQRGSTPLLLVVAWQETDHVTPGATPAAATRCTPRAFKARQKNLPVIFKRFKHAFKHEREVKPTCVHLTKASQRLVQ